MALATRAVEVLTRIANIAPLGTSKAQRPGAVCDIGIEDWTRIVKAELAPHDVEWTVLDATACHRSKCAGMADRFRFV